MFLPTALGLVTTRFSFTKTEKNGPPKPMPEAAKSNSESQKKLYHDMLLIRRFEERAGQLYGMGLIGGFCHLYIGQEAVVVGGAIALLKVDKDARQLPLMPLVAPAK